MHPEDARALGVAAGARVRCRSDRASLVVTVEVDDTVRRSVVTLPHGYGPPYKGGQPVGPAINRLTSAAHCAPFSKTPFHKLVPVSIEPVDLLSS